MDKNLLLVLVENRIHGCEHERTMSIATLNTEGTAPINRSLIFHCLKRYDQENSVVQRSKAVLKKITIWQPSSFLSFFFFCLSFHSYISERSRWERIDVCFVQNQFRIKKKKSMEVIFNELKSPNSFVNRNEKSIKIEQIWSKFDENFVRYILIKYNKK